jgi:hypothetical protein
MSGFENERYFPAPPEAVFAAVLQAATQCNFKVKSSDAYSGSVNLASKASAFSWGANFGTHVIPAEGGALLRMGGQAKMRMNITAKNPEYKNTIKLLDAVSRILQSPAS